MIESWIYLYHLDEVFNIPVTPETLPNNYSSKFNLEEIMNRTAPKVTFSGSGPRTCSVSLKLHTQLYALDNTDKPSVTDLVKGLIACSYPSFDKNESKIVPPSVLIKFGNAVTIRGVISSGVSCSYEEPWLSDGTMAIASINFTVTEMDQYSADYLRQWGTNPMENDIADYANSHTNSIRVLED